MTLPFVPPSPGLGIALGLLAGGFVGTVHFTQLRRSVRLFAEGRLALALAAQALRVLVSATLLAALAWLGIGALLAGLAGFVLARQWLLRREKTTAGGASAAPGASP